MAIQWVDSKVLTGGRGYVQNDIDFFNSQFFEDKSVFLCGFEEMSIADVIAFFAIVPFHLEWLGSNSNSKTANWVKTMLEKDEIRKHLTNLKVK